MQDQFRPDPARKLYGINHCCVYSEELLMMERGIVSFQNKFEKVVHLVGFINRIYHGARSPERQKHISKLLFYIIPSYRCFGSKSLTGNKI